MHFDPGGPPSDAHLLALIAITFVAFLIFAKITTMLTR